MNRVTGLLLASLLYVLVAQPARAQQPFAGVSGGATLGDIFGGATNTSSRWGGTAGLFLGARTTTNTVVQLEGNWVQEGGGDIRLDYIEIPLTFGAAVPTASGMRFRAYGGIDIQFKVSCSGTSLNPGLNCDRANSTVWSIPFGLQFARATPGGKFFALDVRYSLGLSDAFSTSSAYSRSWQFRLLLGTLLGQR
jgi:Outer membrane protein beta-barrel domain